MFNSIDDANKLKMRAITHRNLTTNLLISFNQQHVRADGDFSVCTKFRVQS
jgi:hypothetical protein